MKDETETAEEHRRFCESVHVTPLLDVVRRLGLTGEETEGPSGGGGIDHAHTIALLGDLVITARAERDAALRRARRAEDERAEALEQAERDARRADANARLVSEAGKKP